MRHVGCREHLLPCQPNDRYHDRDQGGEANQSLKHEPSLEERSGSAAPMRPRVLSAIDRALHQPCCGSNVRSRVEGRGLRESSGRGCPTPCRGNELEQTGGARHTVFGEGIAAAFAVDHGKGIVH